MGKNIDWEIDPSQENIDWEIPEKSSTAISDKLTKEMQEGLKTTSATAQYLADFAVGAIPTMATHAVTAAGSAIGDVLQGKSPDYTKARERGHAASEFFDKPVSKALQGFGGEDLTTTAGYTENPVAKAMNLFTAGLEAGGGKLGELTGNKNFGEGSKLVAETVMAMAPFIRGRSVGKEVKPPSDKQTLAEISQMKSKEPTVTPTPSIPKAGFVPETTTPAGDITSLNPLTFKEWKAENKRLKAAKEAGAPINVYKSTKSNYENYKQQHEEYVQAEVRKMEQDRAGTTPPLYSEEVTPSRPSSAPIQRDIEGMDVSAEQPRIARQEVAQPEVNPRQGELFLNERNPFQEGQVRDARPSEPIPQARPYEQPPLEYIKETIDPKIKELTELGYSLQDAQRLLKVRETPKETINASLESGASAEAISRLSDQNARGQVMARLNTRTGEITPLVTAERVDTLAKGHDVVVQRGVGKDEWTVLSKGDTAVNIPGAIERAKPTLSKLGGPGKKQGGASNFGFAEWAADKVKKGMTLEGFTKKLEREIGPQAKIVAKALYAQAQQDAQKGSKAPLKSSTAPAKVEVAPTTSKAANDRFKEVSADLRSASELSKDLVTEGVKDLTPGQVVRSNTKMSPWLIKIHPLVKNVVNRTDHILRQVNNAVDMLLYGGEKTLSTHWGVKNLPRWERSNEAPLSRMNRHSYKDEQLARLGAFEMEGKTWAEAESLLQQKGLSAEVIKTVRVLRETAEKMLDSINESGRKYLGDTWKDIEKVPGWMPHVRIGNYHIILKDITGTTVYRTAVKTKAQAIKAQLELRGKIDGYTLSTEHLHKGAGWDIELSPLVEAISLYKKSSKEYQALDKVMNDIISRKGFATHALRRKDIPGYAGMDRSTSLAGRAAGNKEFRDLYTRYIHEGVNTVARFELRAMQKELIADPILKTEYKNAFEVSDKFLNEALGKKYYKDMGLSELDDWLNNVPSTGLRNIARVGTAWLLLFGKGTMPIQNLLSSAYVLPRLANLSQKGYEASIMRASAQGTLDWLNWKKDPEVASMVNYLVKRGDIEPKFVEDMDIMTSRLGGIAKLETMGKVTANVLTLRQVAGVSEVWGRLHAALVINRYLENSGMKDAATRYEAVGNEVTSLLGNFDKSARISAVNQAGLIGQAYSPLHTFATNWNNMFVYYLTEARAGRGKGLVSFLGLQMALGGVLGFIGFNEADWLIDMINKGFKTNIPTPSSFVDKSNLAPALTSGIPSQLIGVELSQTFGAPSVEQMVQTVPFSWGATMAEGLPGLLMTAAQGNLTHEDRQLLAAKLPGIWKGIAENYLAQDDLTVTNPKKNSQAVYRRDKKEQVMKTFGLTSLKEAKSKRVDWYMTQWNQNQIKQADKHLDAIMDMQDVPEHFQALMQMGTPPETIISQIKARKKGMSILPEERIPTSVKQAKTLQERGAYGPTP